MKRKKTTADYLLESSNYISIFVHFARILGMSLCALSLELDWIFCALKCCRFLFRNNQISIFIITRHIIWQSHSAWRANNGKSFLLFMVFCHSVDVCQRRFSSFHRSLFRDNIVRCSWAKFNARKDKKIRTSVSLNWILTIKSRNHFDALSLPTQMN